MDTFGDPRDRTQSREPAEFKTNWYKQRQRILTTLKEHAPRGAVDRLFNELTTSESTAAIRKLFYNNRCPSYGTYKEWMNRQIPEYLKRVCVPKKSENEWQNYILHPHASLYKHDEIVGKPREQAEERIRQGFVKSGWHLERLQAGQGCTNPEFNRLLIMRRPHIPINELQEKWNALEKLDGSKTDKQHLLSYALTHKPGIKEPDAKIRIANDFWSEERIDIQETDYFSSLMTDQLAWKYVHSRALQDDGRTPVVTLWDGTSKFIDGQSGQLKGLREATISNQLGASTLAFTTDDHLIIVYQNAENSQSAHMLAPSGSGSLDWADVKNSAELGKGRNLLTLVRYGAERELREECALNGDGREERYIRSKIVVTGFVRMLHRAGKPEFYCLAHLDATANEIVARKPERYGERFVQKIYSFKRDGRGAPTRPIDKLIRVCRSYLETIEMPDATGLSYPLEHSLRLLIEACEDQQCRLVLDRFMRAKFT